MNNFKRIAAFALGLGGGIAAGYLSQPRMRNKLRNRIVFGDKLSDLGETKTDNLDKTE